MENIQHPQSIAHCRLCDDCGQHEIDIWNDNNEIELSEKIYQCVGVQVIIDLILLRFFNAHVSIYGSIDLFGFCIISRPEEMTKRQRYANIASD